LRFAEPGHKVAAATTPGEKLGYLQKGAFRCAGAKSFAERMQILEKHAQQDQRPASTLRLFLAAGTKGQETVTRI
jgi:hypothetical protein